MALPQGQQALLDGDACDPVSNVRYDQRRVVVISPGFWRNVQTIARSSRSYIFLLTLFFYVPTSLPGRSLTPLYR